jgi:hypothetical protein
LSSFSCFQGPWCAAPGRTVRQPLVPRDSSQSWRVAEEFST